MSPAHADVRVRWCVCRWDKKSMRKDLLKGTCLFDISNLEANVPTEFTQDAVPHERAACTIELTYMPFRKGDGSDESKGDRERAGTDESGEVGDHLFAACFGGLCAHTADRVCVSVCLHVVRGSHCSTSVTAQPRTCTASDAHECACID